MFKALALPLASGISYDCKCRSQLWHQSLTTPAVLFTIVNFLYTGHKNFVDMEKPILRNFLKIFFA